MPLPAKSRKASGVVFQVPRTGIHWNALPKSTGSSSAVHRYVQFRSVQWKAGLAVYDGVKGIERDRPGVGGYMVGASLAREAEGRRQNTIPSATGKEKEDRGATVV